MPTLFIEVAYDSSTRQNNTFSLYQFKGNHPFSDQALLLYSHLNDKEVSLRVRNPDAYYLDFETRIYPKHPQHVRALIHFLLTDNWPLPTQVLTTVYDYPSFTALDRLPIQ